jgi:hypothetical protein
MVSFGSRRGEAGALSVYLMAGAFLSAVGLMAWLWVRAAPVEVEVVEGGSGGEEVVPTVVATSTFGTNPTAQAGMLIQLNEIPVQSRVGSEAFFVEVAGQPGPYLVKLTPEVAMSGVVIENGATVSLVGEVYAMSDSVADAWVASGGISEGDRILAVFAESFFEAAEVTVTAEPPPEND